VHGRIADPVARPDVDQPNLQTVEIQHESVVEQRRRQRRLDPIEAVVLPQLPADRQHARPGYGEHQPREQAIGATEQLLVLPRVGALPHAVRHRSMRNDLGAREDLIAPHMVAALAGIDHALRPALPDAAEQLRHPVRVGQVGLRVDAAATAVDESRVRVADAVLLVQDRKAAFAHLLQFHIGHHVRGVRSRCAQRAMSDIARAKGTIDRSAASARPPSCRLLHFCILAPDRLSEFRNTRS
jgi:hypothetical protein